MLILVIGSIGRLAKRWKEKPCKSSCVKIFGVGSVAIVLRVCVLCVLEWWLLAVRSSDSEVGSETIVVLIGNVYIGSLGSGGVTSAGGISAAASLCVHDQRWTTGGKCRDTSRMLTGGYSPVYIYVYTCVYRE